MVFLCWFISTMALNKAYKYWLKKEQYNFRLWSNNILMIFYWQVVCWNGHNFDYERVFTISIHLNINVKNGLKRSIDTYRPTPDGKRLTSDIEVPPYFAFLMSFDLEIFSRTKTTPGPMKNIQNTGPCRRRRTQNGM